MEPRVAVFIEENLILGERYRNSYPLEAALSERKVDGKLTPAELDTLTQRRLLRVDPQGGEPRLELIHDRLVGVVRDARDARRALENQQQEREQAEQRARADSERLAQAEVARVRVARWRNGLAVTVAMLVLLGAWLIYLENERSRLIEDYNRLADDASAARAAALAEFEKVTQALTQYQRAIAVSGSSPSGDAPSRAAAEKANDATREALDTVAVAQQKLQDPKGQSRLLLPRRAWRRPALRRCRSR
jgi:hypothetical protein